ncbi:MAG: endopeptidase La [Kiritimatiellae bacterium]|nr:endopeptidase La [Kiritimatiellia bacterium]
MADQKKNVRSTLPANSDMPGRDAPVVLPVLPLNDLVLFPTMIIPLAVSTQRSIRLIDDVVAGSRHFLAVLQRDRKLDDDKVEPPDLHEFGCLARVLKMIKFPDETVRVLVQGIVRCQIRSYLPENGYLKARYTLLQDEMEDSIELDALARNASQRFQDIITMSPAMPEELKVAAVNMADAGKLADLIASNVNIPLEDRQRLLEEYRPRRRLEKLTTQLNRELEILQLGTQIQSKVSETLSKSQRDYYLREQLKAIQSELGEDNPQQTEMKEISGKIKAAKLPPDVAEIADKERKRLESIPSASPEYAVIRTYLDWLTELPWAVETVDRLDIAAAKKVLDADHYDLARIKDRILEYLSVLKLKKDMKGPILCFAGPPGVGKTSLGKSIARALGRRFIRMSLGGVHDEAEIRGHRRTYIGALPGRIIQGLKRAGTRNPVFMLDEIDKVGADFRGDPSSALLEVLDPEQNYSFSDHYLNVPFDLSHVLFITTANTMDTIPPALRDRMEVLELSGYTMNEKLHIAQKFLIRKEIAAHGLKSGQIAFEKAALEKIISDYTREAGVRNLEREVANVCRKVARSVAEGKKDRTVITPQRISQMLGPEKYESEVAEARTEPGIVTGLAWTPVGGRILFIEATQMSGKGQLILTGSLGNIMKESARAALSYVQANSKKLKIEVPEESGKDIHIHVPAGAIPKDGPSAGVAMTMALITLMTGRPLPADIAMTGEITLRGKVMPVGGIKEKVLAAAAAGIRTVILPKRNLKDLHEVPAEIRRKLKFRGVENMDQVVRAALNVSSRRKKS